MNNNYIEINNQNETLKNNNLITKVLETISKYSLIQNQDKIVIGVSGGPDSVCLLYALNELKDKFSLKIYVAHVNHMLREEAELETKYVEKICANLNIQCFIKRIDILEESKKGKIGTEEAGRVARYNFFEEVLQKVGANKIATAHNANDNAETVLMNIFRGTGVSGLKGIEPIRDGKFIRPIIECYRNEIENFCNENNLEPKIDKSNFENVYTRNKIRNIVLPYIKEEFNPNIVKSINRLSELVSNENDFLEKYCDDVLENQLKITTISEMPSEAKNCFVLDLKEFNKLDKVIKNRIVILSIQKVLGSVQGIEKIHVEDIVKLCERNIGNKYLTPNKNIKVFVKSGKVYFYSL